MIQSIKESQFQNLNQHLQILLVILNAKKNISLEVTFSNKISLIFKLNLKVFVKNS
jgi:hypothetical protein